MFIGIYSVFFKLSHCRCLAFTHLFVFSKDIPHLYQWCFCNSPPALLIKSFYISPPTHIYIYTHTHTYTYTHIHTHTHTHIHTHMHTFCYVDEFYGGLSSPYLRLHISIVSLHLTSGFFISLLPLRWGLKHEALSLML